MKNILIITVCLLTFGCSKKADSTVQPQSTWISGKWKMTAAYTDTIASNSYIDQAAYPDELNFTSSSQVFSKGANSFFNYSLTTMSVDEDGVIYTIKQLSSTKMSLTNAQAHLQLEEFTKE